MASIRKEVALEIRPEAAWAAIRAFGEVHRLVPGFVVECRVEDGARVVTFGNGMVARELLVDLDDAARRLVWAAVGTRLSHHNGAMQVFAEGPERCRVLWTTDLLPHEMAPTVGAMMDQSLAAMRRTLQPGTAAET